MGSPAKLAKICNETALMVTMVGYSNMADLLLRREAKWLEAHGEVQLLAHCWMNRCRIWVATGRAEDAVSCLGHMAGHAMRPDVPQILFGLVRNDAPEFRQLRHTWIIETLRTLLKTKEFDKLLVFSDSVFSNCPHETTCWFLTEARATAYTARGEFGRACQLVDGHVRANNPAVALTFQLKGAEIRSVAGERDGARRQALRSFDAAMHLHMGTAVQALAWFRFLERTATILHSLGRPEGAVLATRGLAITAGIPDIPTIAGFLALLEDEHRALAYGMTIEQLLVKHQYYSLLPRYGCTGARQYRLRGETAALVRSIASTLSDR